MATHELLRKDTGETCHGLKRDRYTSHSVTCGARAVLLCDAAYGVRAYCGRHDPCAVRERERRASEARQKRFAAEIRGYVMPSAVANLVAVCERLEGTLRAIANEVESDCQERDWADQLKAALDQLKR